MLAFLYQDSAATLCRMLVAVGEANMAVLVDEVGREEGEMGGRRGEMGEEGEACQLALDVTQQLLVRIDV